MRLFIVSLVSLLIASQSANAQVTSANFKLDNSVGCSRTVHLPPERFSVKFPRDTNGAYTQQAIILIKEIAKGICQKSVGVCDSCPYGQATYKAVSEDGTVLASIDAGVSCDRPRNACDWGDYPERMEKLERFNAMRDYLISLGVN